MLPSDIADSCPQHQRISGADLPCAKIQLWSHFMIPVITYNFSFVKFLGSWKGPDEYEWGMNMRMDMEVWVSALGWWKMTSRRLNPRRSWWFGWCGDTAVWGEVPGLYTQSSSEPDIWDFTMVLAGRRGIRRKGRGGGEKYKITLNWALHLRSKCFHMI